MTLLIELLGSIAILLWGLRMVRTGVMRSYGTNIKRFARRSEGKIFPAFLSGLIVAALLQSSTAAVLISASFAGQSLIGCLLYTSPSPRDRTRSRMPSSA